MLNIIWCSFILISIIFGLLTGNIGEVNNSIFSSIENATNIIIKLIGSMCFWCGVMQIIKDTSINKFLKKFIAPINKIIFPNLDENSVAYENISMNMVTNMLGIGNAATPLGLKAVEELEKNNLSNGRLSDYEVMFIAINTASLQIIPTNIFSIRAALGSENPGSVLIGIWFSSICTFLAVVILSKIYLRIR